MRFKTANRRYRVSVSLAVLLWLVALPASVAAHAELVTADPPDGATLSTPPGEIVLMFSEALDPGKSSVTLHDSSGAKVAGGSEVDATDNKVMRLVPPAVMAPGTYEIRWTSAALDGHIEHGLLHFTLTAPTPSPTPAPTATATTAASASPSSSPSPSASPSPSPSPSATPGPTSASGGEVIVPIVAAVVVVGILGAMLLRGRSRGGGPA
jgi:methionine-rich copper-binding protein CopC